MTYFSSFSFFTYKKFGGSYTFWDKYFFAKKYAYALKCGVIKPNPDPKPTPIDDCGCEPTSLKIDFNDLAKGTIVSNQFQGVKIQALVTRDVCITVEAESMHRSGFAVATGWNASGGQIVRLCDSKGTLTTTFSGPSSVYDVRVRVQDDCLGKSKLELRVDGKVVKTFFLDSNNHGLGSDHGGFNTITLKGVTIPQGAKVQLVAYRDGWEAVRIDSLTFVGTVTENRAMIVDTDKLGSNGPLELKNGDGKVLVISDGNASNPTDRAQGGKIEFAFDKLSIVTKLTVIDLEDGGKVEAFDENGNLIGTVTIGKQAKASVKCVDLDFDGVAKLVVTLNGRGAIDDLCYHPIPEEPDNTDPVAVADIAKLCANASVAIDVLKNDFDVDGDGLTITAIKVGDAFVSIAEGGSVTLQSGAVVTLSGGKLVYSLEGADDFDGLAIGQKRTDTFTYQISDGKGGLDEADVTVTVCGDTTTLDVIAANLPTSVNFTMTVEGPIPTSTLYTITINSATGGSYDLTGVYFRAFCANADLPSQPNIGVNATVHLFDQVVSGNFGGAIETPGGASIANWILNKKYDGTFTEAEEQWAMWLALNEQPFDFTANSFFAAFKGSVGNAVSLYQQALSSEGALNFRAGEGDLVGLLLKPVDATPAAAKQPFIIGVAFDDLRLDCDCLV
ncbi:MAG: Ig-like domain-containing protein [Rubrimonas sp.]